MDSKIKIIFIGIILYYLIMPTSARAYIDPGTGSYIVQVVIGVLLGVILSIRIFWIHIISFIKKLSKIRDNKSNKIDGDIKKQ